MKTSVKLIAPAAALLVPAAMAFGAGTTVDVSVDEFVSWGAEGDPNNSVILVDLGGGNAVTVNGIGWDLVLTTVGGSWASEAGFYFGPTGGPAEIILTAGFATASPVTGAAYSNSILKLADAGVPDIVLADGILQIESAESFVDDPAGPDAFWSGTLTIQYVPTPGALALLGLGGLVGMRRRRR